MKYRREKVLNVVDQRTGKKMTVKDMEDFQAAEDKKEKDIIQVCTWGRLVLVQETTSCPLFIIIMLLGCLGASITDCVKVHVF